MMAVSKRSLIHLALGERGERGRRFEGEKERFGYISWQTARVNQRQKAAQRWE